MRNVEISDRPVSQHDIQPCPADCKLTTVHRHLSDGTIQTAYRGFGVTDRGQVVHGQAIDQEQT